MKKSDKYYADSLPNYNNATEHFQPNTEAKTYPQTKIPINAEILFHNKTKQKKTKKKKKKQFSQAHSIILAVFFIISTRYHVIDSSLIRS